MKKFLVRKQLELGQVIPIVVLSIIAIIAFAALILDGGGIMLNRRYAQNAADAGALAGARVLCGETNPDTNTIFNAINQYTTVENNAKIVDWDVTTNNVGHTTGLTRGEVVVVAEVENNAFFAGIFALFNTGEDYSSLTAQATAAAGCFSYGYDGPIMPFMYPCNPPLNGSDSPDCDYKMLSWQNIQNAVNAAGCGVSIPITGNPTNAQAKCINNALFATYPDYVYIVADSDQICTGDFLDPKYENICKLDPNGRYQVNSSQHGWLNLEAGNAGTNRMRGWISGSRKISASTHTWFSTIPGNRGQPIFTALETRIFDVVWIPIVNHICNYKPTPGSACWSQALAEFPLPPGGSVTVVDGQPGQYFAHVVGYAPFFPTCVRHNQSDDCAGWDLAASIHSELSKTKHSLEGYFIKPDSLSGDTFNAGGVDLGLYRALLTH